MCYFEISILNAVEQNNIPQNLREKGFKSKYDCDSEFSLSIRMIMALSFDSVNDVIETFNILRESLGESGLIHEEADEILDYFEDNYIKTRI